MKFISRLKNFFLMHEACKRDFFQANKDLSLSYTFVFLGISFFIFLASFFWLSIFSFVVACVVLIGLLVFSFFNRFLFSFRLNILFFCMFSILAGSKQLIDLSKMSALQDQMRMFSERWVYGQVVSLVRSNEMSDQYIFQTQAWSKKFSSRPSEWESRRLTLRVSAYKKKRFAVQSGDILALKVRLKPIFSTNEDGIFNYSTYLYGSSIDGLAYVQSHQIINLEKDYWGFLYRFREKLASYLSNFEHGGILRSLLLGDRSAVSTDQKQLLQKTGLLHLFVISGLHIGLVFLFVYLLIYGLIFLIKKEEMGRFFSFVLLTSLLVSFFYVLISGMNIPAWRAWLMLVFYVFSRLFGGSVFSLLNGLHFSTSIMLVLFPNYLFSTSFWLSYWAVLGIVLFLRLMRLNFDQSFLKTPFSFLMNLFGLPLFLCIWLLPFFLYLGIPYGVFSGLLNAFLVFLFGWLVVLPVLLGLLFFLLNAMFIADFFWKLSNGLLDFLFFALNYVEHFFWPLWSLQITFWWFLFLSAFLALFCLKFHHRLTRYLSVLSFVLGLFLSSFRFPLSNGVADVYVLDIGHGLSVLVETKNHRLLFDTGYSYQTRFVVLPKLKRLGVSKLDALVISHADQDHAGGANLVLQSFDVKERWQGQENLLSNGGFCQDQQPWVWDGVYFEFIYPWSGLDLKGNNERSCVLMVQAMDQVFLITSDIGFKQEKYILAKHPNIQANVMIVPHQGSRYSSSESWLLHHQNLQYAFFVHSRFNSYRHPAASVVEGYQAMGVHLYSTGCFGGIYMRMGSHIQIKRPRLWPWQLMGLPPICSKMD